MSKPSVRLWSNLTAQRVFASLKVTSPLSAFICPVFISEFNFWRVLSPVPAFWAPQGAPHGGLHARSQIPQSVGQVQISLCHCAHCCARYETFSKAYQVPSKDTLFLLDAYSPRYILKVHLFLHFH